MRDSELFDQVVTYIRKHWETQREPLDAQTDLVERFNRIDPEDFGFFLESFSREFSIAVEDRVYVDRLTIQDLCDVVRAGRWPRVIPAPASE